MADQPTGFQSAVVTDGTGSAWMEDRDIPEPAADEVLVKVRAVGICGSDIGMIHGEGPPWKEYPVVLGHEVCAEVIEPGEEVDGLSPGNRVALHGFLFCGRCQTCRAGRYYQCDEVQEIGFSLDGGYREYAVWPAYTLNPISEAISDAAATQIDTAGCMLHALKRIDPSVADTAAVLGPGPMGLYGVQLLKALGVADIVVTGLYDERLSVAEALGATHTINVTERDPIDAIKDYTNGRGVDICVEAAGAGDVVQTAMQSTANQGQVVLTGLFDAMKKIDPNDVVIKELSVVGGVTSANAIEETVELFERGDLTAEGVVTHEFPLSAYEEALKTVRERQDGVIKAVLRP